MRATCPCKTNTDTRWLAHQNPTCHARHGTVNLPAAQKPWTAHAPLLPPCRCRMGWPKAEQPQQCLSASAASSACCRAAHRARSRRAEVALVLQLGEIGRKPPSMQVDGDTGQRYPPWVQLQPASCRTHHHHHRYQMQLLWAATTLNAIGMPRLASLLFTSLHCTGSTGSCQALPATKAGRHDSCMGNQRTGPPASRPLLPAVRQHSTTSAHEKWRVCPGLSMH